ncbi:cyclophilin-like fold protein [Nostoc sp. UIC 10890]
MLILVLALVMSLSYSACRAENSIPSSASMKMPTEISTKQADSMKINIKVKDKVVTATLIDSKTTQDFISLLPLTLTLEDYARTEKISNLPKRLSTEDAPPGSDPSVGDIAYYAPWGNLAIYYRDFEYSNGLVILGKIDSGIEALNVPGSVEVTIELVQSE